MPGQITTRGNLKVGHPIVIEGPSPSAEYSVVFEDDGETGYFYGMDTSGEVVRILDALHIYNVRDVSDAETPSSVEIGWSIDGLKAVLAIDRYPHAVIDFATRRGYCRTGFPPPGRWSPYSHEWSDEALELFR